MTGINKETDVGCYFVKNEDYEEFLRLHHNHVFVHGKPSTLLERHVSYSPILIDLDFRYKPATTERVFTKDQVYAFVKTYADGFFKFLEHKESIRFFVELKPAPTFEKDLKKDGIHIICPDVTLDYNTLFTLRKYLLEQNIMSAFPGFLNPPADCFDERVIKTNNWFLHGATKVGKAQYDIAYCFIADPDGGFDETAWDESNRDFTSLFSIRYNRETPTPLTVHPDVLDEWRMWEALVDEKPAKKEKPLRNEIVCSNGVRDDASVHSHLSDGICKILNMSGCVWDVSEMTEGYKLTHNSKACLVQEGTSHTELGHSCLFVQKSSATFSCFSHKTKRLPKARCERLWKLLAEEEDEADKLMLLYNHRKGEFELNAFRVLDPPGYMVNVGGRWIHYNRQQLLDMNSGIFLDDEKKIRFIDEWLRDDTIRTYDRLGYYVATDECPTRTFNTFSGFAATELEPTVSDFSLILGHIDILCNHCDADKEFVLDWFAQLLQQPNKLTGICIVINGQHGCGKDIFLSWFGTQIIGIENYFKTARPNIDLFGAFNSSRKNIVFYHIEEGNAVMLNETNVEQFKNYITDEYASIQLKQKDNNTLIRNYNHFAISTNSTSPFKIEPTERRFFGIQASNEKCRNADYFSALSRAMSNPGVVYGFYNFLMTRDISRRDWKNPPQTEYMKTMIAASLPDVFHFVNDFLEAEGTGEMNDAEIVIKASEIYNTYKDWCLANGETRPKTSTSFGNILTSIGGVSKYHRKDGWFYIVKISDVKRIISQYF